jgi:hypothetical protein
MVALTGKVPSGLLNLSLGATEQQFNIDRQGGLLVAQLGAPAEYMTRRNRRYAASSATATGIAAVLLIPTTAAAWVLFNPVDNDRDLVIDAVFCWSISGTLGLGISLIVANAIGLQTTPPVDATNSIRSSLSGGPYDSKAIFGTAHTITGGTPAWCVVASRDQVAAIAVGAGLRSGDEFPGTRIVSPGRELAISTLTADGTTELFGAGVEWHEVDR